MCGARARGFEALAENREARRGPVEGLLEPYIHNRDPNLNKANPFVRDPFCSLVLSLSRFLFIACRYLHDPSSPGVAGGRSFPFSSLHSFEWERYGPVPAKG